jgi:hypothetical protein
MSRPRSVPEPAPAIVDEVKLAWRYKWLVRFATLTAAGEGVLIEHRGTLGERVAHLEAELDRVGERAAAEHLLANLATSRSRWPGGDPFDRSAA